MAKLPASKYKLIAVPIDKDLEVELPDSAIVLNAMYNPETTELCIIALIEKVVLDNNDTEDEPDNKTKDDAEDDTKDEGEDDKKDESTEDSEEK